MDQRRSRIKAYFTLIDKITASLIIGFFKTNFFSALCHAFTGRKNFQVTNKAYFNIINLFVPASYSLFYCLITVSILSRPKQREKRKEEF